MRRPLVLLISVGGATVPSRVNTHIWIPYGLLSLASTITREKHADVRIVDLTLEPNVRNLIAELRPDIIGISATSPEFSKAVEVANDIKVELPSAQIIFGGVHPTLYPESVLSICKAADAVIVGEGEEALLALSQNLTDKKELTGIQGVVTRENMGSNAVIPRHLDLARSQFPDFGLIDRLEDYILASQAELGYRALQMVVTRGCPYRCAYCSVESIHGTRVRTPVVDRLVSFWKRTAERHRVEGFWLKDSDFALDWNWISSLRSEMKRQGLVTRLSVNTNPQNFVKPSSRSENSTIRKERIKALSDLGVTHVWLGIESGSQKILGNYKKQLPPERIRELVNEFQKHGVKPCGFFMIGFWEEDMEDIKSTFDLMDSLSLHSKRLHILNPLPGSRLYDFYQSSGLYTFKPELQHGFSHAVVPTKHFSRGDLDRIYREMCVYFYEGGSRPEWATPKLTS